MPRTSWKSGELDLELQYQIGLEKSPNTGFKFF